MSAVAERFVGGRAAAAEGKCRLAGEIVLIALSVHHFDNAVGIIYAQRTIVAHRNRDLRHETSRPQIIAPWKKLPAVAFQFSVLSLKPRSRCSLFRNCEL